MPNRRYETLILIHPEQGDAGSKDVVARIRQLAENQGAAVSQVQEWGVRELAYPVDRQRRAYHVLLEYRATPQALVEIVRQAENAPPATARPTYGSVDPVPARAAEPAEEGGMDDGEVATADGEGA